MDEHIQEIKDGMTLKKGRRNLPAQIEKEVSQIAGFDYL